MGNLQNLNDKHMLMARLIATGVDQATVAKDAGVAKSYVCRLVNHDELFKSEVEIIRKELKQAFIDKRAEAMEKVYSNVDSVMQELINLALTAEHESVRAKACVDLLAYAIRKKGEEKEKEGEQPYLAVQLNDVDEHDDDIDVNPSINPHMEKIIRFAEGGGG